MDGPFFIVLASSARAQSYTAVVSISVHDQSHKKVPFCLLPPPAFLKSLIIAFMGGVNPLIPDLDATLRVAYWRLMRRVGNGKEVDSRNTFTTF